MRTWVITAAAMACAPIGAAQDFEDGWITDVSIDAAVVMGLGADNDEALVQPEDVLYEFGVDLGAEKTLQSGLTWGGRLVWRAQKDHPERPAGFGGVNDRSAGAVEVGAFSGQSLQRFDDVGPRGSLEAAYLFVEGGYGELSVGRDTGIGSRFFEGDVGVMSYARLSDPILDPLGTSLLRTRNDLTGPSPKVSVTTTRILGFRAGASFTPEADAFGLDRAPGRGPALSNVIEVGVNGTRRLRESGIRFRGGLTFARGELDAEPLVQVRKDVVEVWSGGLEVESGDTRFGATFLTSDEGLVGKDYSAWTVGLSHDWDTWSGSLTYGEASADAAGFDTVDFSIALQRAVTDTVYAGVAYIDRQFDPQFMSGAATGPSLKSRGVVFEVTLRFEK